MPSPLQYPDTPLCEKLQLLGGGGVKRTSPLHAPVIALGACSAGADGHLRGEALAGVLVVSESLRLIVT